MLLAVAVALALPATDQVDARGVVHVTMQIDSADDEWTNTGILIDHGDLVVINASGRVTIGAFMGETGPEGRGGDGQLAAKVGTSVTPIGSRAFFFVSTSATRLKLRVQDSLYSDNHGSYTVDIVVVPAPMIPPAESVSAPPQP